MQPVTIFSPAKINLFLAITGRRPDGFHNLVSLVAPLGWGDDLLIEPAEGFTLTCNDASVPVDGSNLVLRAAEAYRKATGWSGGAAFRLEKKVPMGAGLGGGSSNAVAALRRLNKLAGGLLSVEALSHLAAGLGADCALFMAGAPVIMRGRGEMLEPLPSVVADRLRNRQVLIFKPGFGVPTAWAYGRLATRPADYLPEADAEARLGAWIANPAAALSAILYNNMEDAVFSKYLGLPALHALLRDRFGVQPHMSGSGSASFLLLENGMETGAIIACIREQWGPSAFVVTTFLA